jgi:hypothetical protein
MTMGRTSFEGLIMAKRQIISRICAIRRGMWPCEIWNKVETNVGIHLQNLPNESNFESVQKPFQKGHLQINVACIGMPTWKSQIKAQGSRLVCSLLRKMGRGHQTPLKLEFDWNVEINIETNIFFYLLAHLSQSH